MKAEWPKVDFGIIVLNGEPFTTYCLRSLYPYAHKIIVAEGAAPGARAIATEDGHSMDATLDVLRDFQANHDPENKLIIVTAEDEGYPSGFWPGEKDEQSQAYATRATGDYLWQVDVDEFYREEEMEQILDYLTAHPETTGMEFEQVPFWGGFSSYNDGPYLRYQRSVKYFRRLFKWGNGYTYSSHRPPTVITDKAEDTRGKHWVYGHQSLELGWRLYHYSLVFPKQVQEKVTYYQDAAWSQRDNTVQWLEESFYQIKNPFRTHNVYDYPSWIERYNGEHPGLIQQMQSDISTGKLVVKCRDQEDIDRLLADKGYQRAVEKLRRQRVRWVLWFDYLHPLVRGVKLFFCDPRQFIKRVKQKLK